MVPAACLPTPSGWGDPGPAHDTPTASGVPVDSTSCCPQVCLSMVVLCMTTRPPLAPSSCPRITAIILSSFMGRAWPAAEAAFSRCRSRCGGGGGGVSSVWPQGWAGGHPICRGLGDGEPPVGQRWAEAAASLLVTRPPASPAKAPGALSGLAPGGEGWGRGRRPPGGRGARGARTPAAFSGVRPRGAQRV